MNDFPVPLEDFLRTAARLLASKGARSEVRLLAGPPPEVHESSYDNWNGGTYGYTFAFSLPLQTFSAISQDERLTLGASIKGVMNEILESEQSYGIDEVIIRLAIERAEPEWRRKALEWTDKGGPTNQGRARSDNIAPLQFEGLLFRSQPEIFLFKALKRLELAVAPLPVFVRGGKDYQRLEPDFVLIHKSTMMVVEVDGEAFHHESPVVAHERLALLLHEGVKTERVRSTDCDTEAKAQACAQKLYELLAKYASIR